MLIEEMPYTLDDLLRARQALREAEQRPHGDAHKWARLRLTVVECNLASRGLLPHQPHVGASVRQGIGAKLKEAQGV